MKKHFIADYLTFAKSIPAIAIFFLTFEVDSGMIFILFAIGEFLDALDGMAAKKWPHPPETDSLWFRKNLKLVESGLDLLLAFAALHYIMLRISLTFGVIVLFISIYVGVSCEFLLYGHLFGTPDDAESFSLFCQDVEKAQRVVGWRLAFYCAAIFVMLMTLIYNALWPLWMKIVVSTVTIIIICILIIKKDKDGRINLHRFFE